jgi:hypothetical protein
MTSSEQSRAAIQNFLADSIFVGASMIGNAA